MIREEAMLKIGELGCYARANGWDDDYTEAVNIAIKALEQEPFMNKPCVANQVCHEDKVKVLDKIRTEIEQTNKTVDGFLIHDGTKRTVLQILDKYKANKHEQKPNIKALGEDMRICQKSIKDEKVLIGFNVAVAICNKHLAESEEV